MSLGEISHVQAFPRCAEIGNNQSLRLVMRFNTKTIYADMYSAYKAKNMYGSISNMDADANHWINYYHRYDHLALIRHVTNCKPVKTAGRSLFRMIWLPFNCSTIYNSRYTNGILIFTLKEPTIKSQVVSIERHGYLRNRQLLGPRNFTNMPWAHLNKLPVRPAYSSPAITTWLCIHSCVFVCVHCLSSATVRCFRQVFVCFFVNMCLPRCFPGRFNWAGLILHKQYLQAYRWKIEWVFVNYRHPWSARDSLNFTSDMKIR